MSRLKIILHTLRANGLHWTILLVAEKILRIKSFEDRRMQLEIKERLPGFNTRLYNYREWQGYDWTREGEERSSSEEWKQSLLHDVMHKFIDPGKTVLEIGPGAGRWSVNLVRIARKLILVDLTEKAIDVCKKKLRSQYHCVYFVNNGNNLNFLGDNSIDYLWSFDVFVHISPQDTFEYLKELNRVFAPGAIGIIHHPAAGGTYGGFRSSVTNEMFIEFLKDCNFQVLQQIEFWGDQKEFSVSAHRDMITVFCNSLPNR